MALIGDTQKISIDLVNISTPYPQTKNGTEEYTAPDGLAILSWNEIVWSAAGKHAHSWSTVGDNSVIISDGSASDKFKKLFDYVKSEGKDDEYKERLVSLQEQAKYFSNRTASTHSKLLLKWSCAHNGSEFNRKGGWLHVGAEVTLIRSLSTHNIDQVIMKLMELIGSGVPAAELTLQA